GDPLKQIRPSLDSIFVHLVTGRSQLDVPTKLELVLDFCY
ncbi:MAG: hypothetical protein ACI8QD_002406, partial [Cyclobacteriaceae bacterium]